MLAEMWEKENVCVHSGLRGLMQFHGKQSLSTFFLLGVRRLVWCHRVFNSINFIPFPSLLVGRESWKLKG